jgi:hypothetical protein
MLYFPTEIIIYINDYMTYKDFINILFTNKYFFKIIRKYNYKNNNFINDFNINLNNEKIHLTIIIKIISKINNINTSNIIKYIKNNIKYNYKYKYKNLLSLILILKLSRSIILSNSDLNQNILGSTLIRWMDNYYSKIIIKLIKKKKNIINYPFYMLVYKNIINLYISPS